MSIYKVLDAARLAPSGDNCQQWEIVLSGNVAEIYNLPERDLSPVNYAQHGAIVSHGTLIENLSIASVSLGYKMDIQEFPDPSRPNLVARVKFHESKTHEHDLYPFIAKRTTNRRVYKPIPLIDEEIQHLTNIPKDLSPGRVMVVDQFQNKRDLSDSAIVFQSALLEERVMHKHFFERVRWTEQEARKTKWGFSVSTFELSPVQSYLFKFCSNWWSIKTLVGLLRIFRLTFLMYEDQKTCYLTSPAVGVIVVEGNEDKHFFLAGRILEHVWLEATRMQLGFQPLSGSCFIAQAMESGAKLEFAPSRLSEIKNAYAQIKKSFNLDPDKKMVIMPFRVGKSDAPSGRTYRFPLETIVKSDLLEILKAALQAPSGENFQPWRISVRGQELKIFYLPERESGALIPREMPQLLGHGALIENLSIAASALGYQAKINTFPEPKNQSLIFSVELKKTSPKEEPLYPFIFQRTTNRKKYRSQPLTEEQKSRLLDAASPFGSDLVFLQDDKAEMAKIAEAGTVYEKMLFENWYTHHFFMESVRWSEEDADRAGDGLYIKTLELPPPAAFSMRWVRDWHIAQLFNALRIPSTVTTWTFRRLLLSASALGIIPAHENDPDLIVAGRVLERVWLEATRLGLSFHPMAGVGLLSQIVLRGETEKFSPKQTQDIREAHEKIRSAFHLQAKSFALIFRVGFSDPPSARSVRRSLDQVVDFE